MENVVMVDDSLRNGRTPGFIDIIVEFVDGRIRKVLPQTYPGNPVRF